MSLRLTRRLRRKRFRLNKHTRLDLFIEEPDILRRLLCYRVERLEAAQ